LGLIGFVLGILVLMAPGDTSSGGFVLPISGLMHRMALARSGDARLGISRRGGDRFTEKLQRRSIDPSPVLRMREMSAKSILG
jgi:hypothetical protein